MPGAGLSSFTLYADADGARASFSLLIFTLERGGWVGLVLFGLRKAGRLGCSRLLYASLEILSE